MGYDKTMSVRTCGYCGLRYAQMIAINVNIVHVPMVDRHTLYQSILQCPNCGRITVIEHSSPTEPAAEFRVFPEPDDLRHNVRHLPEDVEQYFSDARRVLDAGVPDAAAVQLRRTLEAAAARFDVRERNLVGSIQKLIDEGYVTRQFGEALHQVRQVGNLGAHATDERVDEESAQRVMSFTTLLLRNLFEVPGELSAVADQGECSAES